MKTQAEKWIATFPELATRPELLKEMEQSKRLKRNVFAAANFLRNVARTIKGPFAARILTLCYQDTKDDLYKLEDKVDPKIYRQIMGLIRNVHVNLMLKAGLKRAVRKGKNEFFVNLKEIEE